MKTTAAEEHLVRTRLVIANIAISAPPVIAIPDLFKISSYRKIYDLTDSIKKFVLTDKAFKSGIDVHLAANIIAAVVYSPHEATQLITMCSARLMRAAELLDKHYDECKYLTERSKTLTLRRQYIDLSINLFKLITLASKLDNITNTTGAMYALFATANIDKVLSLHRFRVEELVVLKPTVIDNCTALTLEKWIKSFNILTIDSKD